MIAISPAVEVHESIQRLGDFENIFYERYFYKLLREEVHDRHKKFKDLPRVRLPKTLKIYEFDQLYTAPMCGFSSAIDYYNKCSAGHVVGDIEIPCQILFAEDDTIISPNCLDRYKLPSNVNVFKTKYGGHLGYLGKVRGERGFFWLDSLLKEWILGFGFH